MLLLLPLVEKVHFSFIFLVVGIDVSWLDIREPAWPSTDYVELVQLGIKS